MIRTKVMQRQSNGQGVSWPIVLFASVAMTQAAVGAELSAVPPLLRTVDLNPQRVARGRAGCLARHGAAAHRRSRRFAQSGSHRGRLGAGQWRLLRQRGDHIEFRKRMDGLPR